MARRVFRKIDPRVRFSKRLEDGTAFRPGDVLAGVEGASLSLLKGERTALNFLQRMSGIATKTRKFVEAAGPGTRILDTRKTTPGLRRLEKYAVRMGGGRNHRFSLSDMVLIKDNHLRLVGGITEAVRRARAGAGPRMTIEVEVTSLAEAREAVAAGAGHHHARQHASRPDAGRSWASSGAACRSRSRARCASTRCAGSPPWASISSPSAG